MITLTQASPQKLLNLQPAQAIPIATSGVTGAGIVKLQYRVVDTDAWLDQPEMEFATDTHLSGILTAGAIFNRVFVEGADGTTQVNVQF
jgi:hypothetical protein